MGLKNIRINREKKTIEKMIEIYCKDKHSSKNICSECAELVRYAQLRLDKCRFGNNKPVCGKCKTHCYKFSMREKIIKVMKHSGLKMLLYHPVLAILHFIDRIFYSK